ncbi:MAG: ATP-binding protein, partial [Oscillospiraceae bacterium]|nr:ATP-binding protein [Oscillospiraceae bacterium]
FIALDDESAIFGECKWTGSPVGEATLDELIRKSKLFPQYTQKRYALFSKSGFTDSLKKNTETNCDVLLISVDDMF